MTMKICRCEYLYLIILSLYWINWLMLSRPVLLYIGVTLWPNSIVRAYWPWSMIKSFIPKFSSSECGILRSYLSISQMNWLPERPFLKMPHTEGGETSSRNDFNLTMIKPGHSIFIQLCIVFWRFTDPYTHNST